MQALASAQPCTARAQPSISAELRQQASGRLQANWRGGGGRASAARRLLRPRSRARRPRGAGAAPPVLAARDPYDVLGLDRRSATLDDVKKAFRKRALKLHPDVNKAPDARERFMEAKQAYQELLEVHERRQQWRGSGARAGGAAGASAWGGGAWGGAGYGAQQRPRQPQQQEEFYGLGELFHAAADAVLAAGAAARRRAEDFFRDLDKEVDDYSRRRAERAAAFGTSASPSSAAASASASGDLNGLWEELRDIGEEFVEFLEMGMATDTEEQDAFNKYRAASRAPGAPSAARAGGGGGAPRRAGGAAGASVGGAARAPPGGGNGAAGGGGAAPQRAAADAIEDELQALKRKLGKL